MTHLQFGVSKIDGSASDAKINKNNDKINNLDWFIGLI